MPARHAKPLIGTDDNGFYENGWTVLPYSDELLDWIKASRPAARQAIADPANAEWLRCGGTWHVGVNLLDNDAFGRVDGGPALPKAVMKTALELAGLDSIELDRAQLSVMYPGYPQPWEGESEAAFRYRRDRDAAHVDGLHPVGDDRRRFLREYHAFILGIPMVAYSPGASPLAVWNGSHHVVRHFFQSKLNDLPVNEWGDVDLTEGYHQLRREIFESCERVTLYAQPGEAYLTHRLLMHGVAPWGPDACAGEDGRMICYFRPEYSAPSDWLEKL